MSDTKISEARIAAAQERIDAYHPQPAELAEQQGVELPPLPVPAHESVSECGPDYFDASQMREYARAALAATGKQQVGENPAWRDELVREAHARGLMEGLNSPRPQQVGEVQGDALVQEALAYFERAGDAGDRKYVEAIRNALAARQPGAQVPVIVEAVATIKLDDDQEPYIDWVVEGGIHALPVGDVLIAASGATITDDEGYGEVYTAPPAQDIYLGQQRPLIARSLAEWHEDDGNVMWWARCGRDWAGEPAWCGTPNDSDWPGYHTHWTQHPTKPALIDQRDAAPGVGS